MATTTQLLTISRAKLLESGTEILTDATLLIYANWAYQDISRRAFPASSIKSATVNFTNGIGILPSDFGTLYGSSYSGDTPFNEMSIGDFAGDENGVTVEGGSLKIYPTDTASVTIKYWPSFAALSASQDPQTNTYFEELIVYGILYRAYEDLQDEALSKYYRDKYEFELNQKISVQSNYEEDNVRGGQMFIGQNLLGGRYGISGSPDYM